MDQRQSAFTDQLIVAYQLWRNKVQPDVKAAKQHYYHNKEAEVEQESMSDHNLENARCF